MSDRIESWSWSNDIGPVVDEAHETAALFASVTDVGAVISTVTINGEEHTLADGPIRVTSDKAVSVRHSVSPIVGPEWHLIVSRRYEGKRIWWKPWKRKQFKAERWHRLETPR